MDKFDIFDDLYIKGRLTSVKDVGGVKVGYRTLTHEEETIAIANAQGSLSALKVEQLCIAITSINGSKVSDDINERDTLRKKLMKLPSTYINTYYRPYVELMGSIPELTEENITVPLGKTQDSDQSMTSVSTVDTFQTTP